MLQTFGSCKIQDDDNICQFPSTQVSALSFSLDDSGVFKLKDSTGAVTWFQRTGEAIDIVEAMKVALP